MFGIRKDPAYIIKKSIGFTNRVEPLEKKIEETKENIEQKKNDVISAIVFASIFAIVLFLALLNIVSPYFFEFFKDNSKVLNTFILLGISYMIAHTSFKYFYILSKKLNERHLRKEKAKLVKLEIKLKRYLIEESFYFKKLENQNLVVKLLEMNKPAYDTDNSVKHNQIYLDIKKHLENNNIVEAFKIFGNYCKNYKMINFI